MLTHTLLYYIIDQPACLDVKPTHTHLLDSHLYGQSNAVLLWNIF